MPAGHSKLCRRSTGMSELLVELYISCSGGDNPSNYEDSKALTRMSTDGMVSRYW